MSAFGFILFLLFFSSNHQVMAEEKSEILNPFVKNETIIVPSSKQKAVTINVDKSFRTKSSQIAIKARLLTGEKVNMVVLFGSQSESVILSKDDSFTALSLCHTEEDEFDSVHVLAHSFDHDEDSEIFIEAFWEDISLELGGTSTDVINPKLPATYLITHNHREDYDRNDRFILNVETTKKFPGSDKHCMVVAVYNQECPLHNRPSNVKSAEMWTTAQQSATLTIRADKFCFNDNFYVSVVVLPNNDDCTMHRVPGDECIIADPFNIPDPDLRQKEITVTIDKILPYKKYVTPIILAVIIMFFLIVVSYCILIFKSYGDTKPIRDQEENEENKAINGNIEHNGTDSRSIEMEETTEIISDEYQDAVDGQLGEGEPAKNLCNDLNDAIENREDKRKEKLKKGFNRMKGNPTMADNKIMKDDIWFRRNRSKVYFYLVPLISIFYFVPAIQFAFQAKENEEMTGSMDLCYHNFKCARPLWIFSDFNHVISNISYIIFGLVFMFLAFTKTKQLPEDHHPSKDHNCDTGLLQQMSIFYAMGFSLMAQGFFSVCYHVCPTNLSLQFDTTMMYVICVLCYVKLYQFRHPDATANAYSTFGLLGLVVFLEALALYSSSWIVYGIFLGCYIATTIFIAFDCYYLGVGRTDFLVAVALAKDIVFHWKPVRNLTPQDEVDVGRVRRILNYQPPKWIKYPRRFGFSLIFVIVNFSYAIFTAYRKVRDPQKNVTHVLLNILAGNLILYLIYYLVRKKCCHSTESQYITNKKWTLCSKIQIPPLISPGSFFAILALFFGAVAISFYVNRSANRNYTPAESRDLNSDCVVLDFYDNHDVWHFFSAAGIFMAFMALLTVDDDLLYVPRDKIDVF